jgi:regulator of RNase E activity RraA
MAGFALTVQAVAVDSVPADRATWYAGEIGAVDSQQVGDVMVVSTCPGSYWGELLATASRARGARGIVADCYTRDTRALHDMAYPTFVAGVSAQDSLGRIDVTEVGGTIQSGGVQVTRGDLVLADEDGIAVIPAEVADEVLSLAEQKVATEDIVRGKLAEGAAVREVFAAHGVL